MVGIKGWWQQRAEKEATATVETLRRRSRRLLELARKDEAVLVLTEAVRISEATFGPDAPLTLASRMDRVSALIECQRNGEAEVEALDVLRRYDAAPEGLEDTRAHARCILARALILQARFAEAETEVRRVVAARGTGVSDEVANAAWKLLALTVGGQGRHAEAVREFDALIEILEKGSPEELTARTNRAVECGNLGRLAEAESEHRAVGSAAISISGRGGAILRLVAQHNLALTLSNLGRHEQAEKEALAGIASAARRGPHFARFAFLFQVDQARILNERGQHTDALRIVERALAGRPQAARTPDETDRTDVVRATALLGLGRTVEAMDLVNPAVGEHRSHFGPVHFRTLSTETLHGRCLIASGRIDEGRDLLRANVESWRRHYGPEHHGTAAAERALAEALTTAS